MSGVIDSFVVELGLDPSKFTKGQREALEAARKLEEQTVKSGQNIEQASLKAGDAIGTIRTQALELFAALGGGAAVINFAAKMTAADAAVGRLSRNIGVSSTVISKWQGLARIMGGDAAQMAASFTTISDAFAGWKIGIVSPLIADLRAISTAGGKIIDVNKGVEQSYLDLAENLKRIHDRDPAMAGLLGRRVGLDPYLYDILVKGPAATQKMLDEVKGLGTATKESTDAANDLATAWNKVGIAIEGSSRGSFTVLGKGLADGLSELAKDISGQRQFVGTSKLQETGWSGLWSAIREGFSSWRSSKPEPAATAAAGGRFTSQTEKEQFIRAEAARRGINPNVAMAVARSEGFNSFVSTIPGETSYGAFQLNVSPGGRKGHLGDQFRAKTGLDPSDPANERATIMFALDDATRNGWAAFHGAKNTGIGRWEGIDRARGGSTSTTEVNINGPINVTPPAGADANQFAGSFADAVKRQTFAAQANSGQQ